MFRVFKTGIYIYLLPEINIQITSSQYYEEHPESNVTNLFFHSQFSSSINSSNSRFVVIVNNRSNS